MPRMSNVHTHKYTLPALSGMHVNGFIPTKYVVADCKTGLPPKGRHSQFSFKMHFKNKLRFVITH